MNKNYISPHITKYPSFKVLLKDKDPYGYFGFSRGAKLSFDELFSRKRVFIVTEPGHGKTRLLKEAIVKGAQLGKQGIFIDLKKIDGDLKSFILKKNDIVDEIDKKLTLQTSNLFKTKGFTLKNTDKVIVCLDALDEIKQENFSRVVDSIKEFSRRYNNIFIFVSCRYHHFNRFQELFMEFDFDYMRIDPFSREQVSIYFENAGISKVNIEKITRTLEFKNRKLVIQTPRYLEMMVAWIKEKGLEDLRTFTKAEIFEWFIYRKLELEGKKLNFQKKEIIKRVLEKIALLMEMYQTNILKKEELITVFDDVKSNLNISFLQQVPLEFFYERSVLKDNVDTIEFENTEFQEYLAAKEILRLGKLEQTVFDLVVDQELQEIFPSWFNTLSFLVDLDISLVKPLLEFGASKSKGIQDEEYHRFLTKVDVDRLVIEKQEEIFKNVFTYYQNILHWIPFDVARNLSHYFSISQDKLLRKSIITQNKKGAENFVRKGNVSYIIAFLMEQDILSTSQKEFWQEKLIEFARDKNKNGVLQRHSLFALGKFKNVQLLKRVSLLKNSDDELIVQNFMEACMEANPGDSFSIQAFVDGTKKENIYARYGLYQVRDKWSVKKMLEHFSTDESFLFQFIEQESIFKDRDDEIICNIANVWDNEIKSKLQNIIKSSFSGKYWYLAKDSGLIKGIISLLKEKDKNYIFALIKSIKASSNMQKNWFSFEKIFALLINKNQVSKFVQELKGIKRGANIALGTLCRVKYSNRKNANEIYEEGRKHFKRDYTQLEKNFKKQSRQLSDGKCAYKKFRFKLQPSKGKYYPDVFQFYINNKDKIKTFITKKDIKRLTTLIQTCIFKKFSPDKQKLIITKKNAGGSMSYTTHAWISIFGKCLIIATDFGMNVSKYRKKIIGYIPFAYHDHLKAIFSLVSNLKKDEISYLLKIYNGSRKDDLTRFMPSSFIEACENYNVMAAPPILKKFVEQNKYSIYERRTALKVIVGINAEKRYLEKIFKKYKNQSNEMFQLAETANKYLIEILHDDAAICWRLNQLKRKATPFIKPKGAHGVGELESELWDKKFAQPLMNLKSPKYKKRFLELLNTSFLLLKKGDDYRSYTSYLWEIVIAYFDNLKETKSYSHLKELERYVHKLSSAEGTNWFKGKLKELRRKYMEYIGKPRSISDCIKHYNRLKESQYLNITTPRDLIEIIKEIVGKDIKQFVEEQGFYKSVRAVSGKQEDLIQKTLTTQLENGFLRKGLRENEVNIRREEQLLDDKRTDFLIAYGFIGPVLIEIKRSDNKEISVDSERKQYKKKFLQYIKGTKAHLGMFIVFQISDKHPLEKYLPSLRKLYKESDHVDIIGLDCLKSGPNNS